MVMATDSERGVAPELFMLTAPLLRPEEQVFEGMIDGWINQQRSRGLRA